MRDATQIQGRQERLTPAVPAPEPAQKSIAPNRTPHRAPNGASWHEAGADEHRQTVIRPWSNLLERTIATDILPRMLASHHGDPAADATTPHHAEPGDAEIDSLLTFILADDLAAARRLVDQVVARGTQRDKVLNNLLGPVARRLGELWEQDRADFAAVTLGMIRLNQLMRDTAEPISEAPVLRGRERHLLIAAAPGEQHSFGVAVVADLFRRAGWIVQSEPVMARASLMSVVRRNWFDVVGLSVTADRGLKGLPAVIRALRRTALNPALGIMVGGKVFIDHPERAQFVGADATARDGQEALYEAGSMIERMQGQTA